MALPINIPAPCHESWNGMTPADKGRHCAACDKVVVDFTNWESDRILDYLKNNWGACGRFTADQLLQPEELDTNYAFVAIAQSSWHRINKLAVSVVFLFLLSSSFALETNAQFSKANKVPVARIDTPFVSGKPQIIGEIALISDTTSNKDKMLKPFVDTNNYPPRKVDFRKSENRNKKAEQLKREHMIMGIVAYPPTKK